MPNYTDDTIAVMCDTITALRHTVAEQVTEMARLRVEGADACRNELRHRVAQLSRHLAESERVLTSLCDWSASDGDAGTLQIDDIVADARAYLEARGLR